MGKTLKTSVCVLALIAVGSDAAWAARRISSNCADSSEVTAIQVAVIQQELMDAALGCGEVAQQNFNAFQTSFGPELRKSDKTLLRMFRRVHGSKGDAVYNLFKTDMASKAEIRRVRGMADFCKGANLVFAAALAPDKPELRDFVSGIQVSDTNDSDFTPVQSCKINVAVTLQGVQAAPNIVPTPNPLRVAELAPAPVTYTPTSAPVAPTPVVPPPPAPEPPKKKSGWFSGVFQ